MKLLSYKTIRLISLTLIVAMLLSQTQLINNLLPRKAYAVGDLTVTWQGAGTGDTGPIFSVSNMAPGQSSQKTITVQNDASSVRPISIRGVKTNETGSLGSVLDIVISRNGTDVYGGALGDKTLSQFFTESASMNGIPLGMLSSGTTATYLVKVTFKNSAGNEFQSKTLTFNLVIGIAIDIPVACSTMQLDFAHPIYGTQNADRINGTNGNDLIYGLEGADTIDGGNGNDCIIGGDGNNKLNGGNGADVLIAGNGNDKLEGGNGADVALAGEGMDTLNGGNENDQLNGEGGNDALDGGNGRDQILGGLGNDTMKGGNENDTLNGEAGADTANGQNGKDTCIAETKNSCEL